MAVDWYIETDGGRCIVRLVHSGWDADAKWDEQYDANAEGWRYFLFNLRYYLEHHENTPRVLVYERRPSLIPRAQLWPRLLGAPGLGASTTDIVEVHAGDDLTFQGPDGRALTLRVGRAGPAVLWKSIAALNDALLLIEFEPGDERYHAGMYLSLYGVPTAEVDELRQWIQLVANRAISIANRDREPPIA